VTLFARLDPHGRVDSVRIDDSSLPSPQAQGCLLEHFRSIRFGAPPDGKLSMRYPLVFRQDDEPDAGR
jgi:hypothetical protein